MYKNKFKEAIERSKRLNLEVPNIYYDNKQYASIEILEKIPYFLREEFGEFEIEDLAAQCLNMNLKLKDFMADLLKTDVYYTIGYIQFDKDSHFKQTEETLKEMIQEENNTGKVNLHVWLTLPSMEILDPTILTTYSLHYNYPEGLGGMIFNDADKVKHMEFIPMLVGDDFIYQAKLIRGFIFNL